MVLHHDVSVSRRLQHLLGLRLLRCFLSVEIVNGGSDAGFHPVLSMAGDRPSALALLGHSPESSRHEKMEVRGAVKPRSSGGNQSVGSGLPARSSMAIRPGPFAPKIWNAL